MVVYDRPSGLTSADRAKAAADARLFAGVTGVVKGQVAGPILASGWQGDRDHRAGQPGLEGLERRLGRGDQPARHRAGERRRIVSHIAGPLGNAADSANAFKGIDGTLLAATLVVVIMLLLLTYRSPVLWLLPVISAAVALVTAEGLIYLLAKHAGLTVNAQSAGILDVLVFGAGTDYALLLTARYREELRRH